MLCYVSLRQLLVFIKRLNHVNYVRAHLKAPLYIEYQNQITSSMSAAHQRTNHVSSLWLFTAPGRILGQPGVNTLLFSKLTVRTYTGIALCTRDRRLNVPSERRSAFMIIYPILKVIGVKGQARTTSFLNFIHYYVCVWALLSQNMSPQSSCPCIVSVFAQILLCHLVSLLCDDC